MTGHGGLQLRDYQAEAVDAVLAAEQRGVQRPLVALPTGTGKTVVFAELFRRRAGRGLVLAHREELLEQARDKIRLVIPGAEVGIVKAERDERHLPIVVASVQTLVQQRRLARLLGRQDGGNQLGLEGLSADGAGGFQTVVIDEAHHATAPTYRRILGQLGGFHPDGPLVLGVTATPERGDRAALGKVWQEIVYRRDVLEMIEAGHLCDLRAVRVRLDVDLDRVHVREGDFVESELADAMTRADAPEHALQAYREHAADRKALVFTPTVALAHRMAETFERAGVAAAALDGTNPAEERREVLEAFRRGQLKVLANCALLTEGYDEPSVDCLILARPTRSRPLYVQMLGRGTRRWPGKTDCLVVDLVGVSQRHDLVTVASLFGLDPDRLADRGSVLAARAPDGEAGEEQTAASGGRLVSEVVDLFAERDLHWSCGDGVYVLSAGSRGQVVLQEIGGTWSVSALKGKAMETIASGLDLGYAQGVAEDAVRRMGGDQFANPEAPWRALSASEAQLALLEQRGLRPTPQMTRGEASDLLSVTFATAALAPATPRQLQALRRFKVAIPEGLTKRQASQLLDQAMATRAPGAPFGSRRRR